MYRRALLGPIRQRRVDWLQPEDRYDLGGRQPANIGAIVPDEPTAVARPVTREAAPVAPAGVRVLARLIDLAGLAVAAILLARAARVGTVSTAEATRDVRVVAAARPDVGTLPGGLPQRIFDAVAASWVSLTDALHRYTSTALAVREPLVIAAALTVLMVWLLAVRLRLTLPTRLALVLATGAAPGAAALLAGAARPGVLATLLVVVAAVLISGVQVAPARKVVALVALGVAVLLVPPVAPALLVVFAVLYAQGDLGPRLRRPQRYLVGAVFAVGAVALVAVLVTDRLPASLRSGPSVALPTPRPVDWALMAVFAVLSLSALSRRWLRAPAAAVGVALLTAVVYPDARGDLAAVALPLAALVGLAHAEELIGRRTPVRPARIALRRAVAAALAVGVVVVGVVAVRTPVHAEVPAPAGDVAAWFTSEVPGAPLISVDDQLWPLLLRAGMPAKRLVSGTATPGVRPADWMVTRNRPGAGWTRYAVFGSILVAHREATGGQADVDMRRADGTALAGNPAFTFAAPAAAELRAGQVDERLILELTNYAGSHTLAIADFPAVAGETPGAPPLRRALLTTIDGQPADNPPTVVLIQNWLMSQLQPFKACGVEPAGGTRLLIRYCVATDPG